MDTIHIQTNSYSYSLSCGESISSEWLCSLSSTETTPNSMDHKVQLQSSHDSKDYPPPPPSDCLSSTENTSHDLIQNMNTARCDSPPLSHQKKWLVKDSNNLYRIRYAPDKTQFQEKHLLTKDIELFINAFYSSVLFYSSSFPSPLFSQRTSSVASMRMPPLSIPLELMLQ